MRKTLTPLTLNPGQFDQIRHMVYALCGINLSIGKEELIKCRLMKRLHALGMDDFDRYIEYVRRDRSGQELAAMIDLLTTNKTSFFRESQHFEYLRRRVLPKWAAPGRRVRIWSAGCSSGEEPFSLAILLREELSDIDRRDVRILATDISERMLARARTAVYEEDALQAIPPFIFQKHFTAEGVTPTRTYRVSDAVRAMVRLARLNLMASWPMRGPFDAIFCRNVMIYFGKSTQQALVHRFWKLLMPGGHLFVGHSESLAVCAHEFRYVQPAVYVK